MTALSPRGRNGIRAIPCRYPNGYVVFCTPEEIEMARLATTPDLDECGPACDALCVCGDEVPDGF